MLPDNFTQMVVRAPSQYDVVVFDDLLRAGMVSDLGSLLMGSMGMIASGEIRPNWKKGQPIEGALRGAFGLYEPAHGTVDHRVGQDVVNPIGAVLSAEMLLRYSLDLPAEADAVDRAILDVLSARRRTYDVMEPDATEVRCSEMGDLLADAVLIGRAPLGQR